MGHGVCRAAGMILESQGLWGVCPLPDQSWVPGIKRPIGWRAAQGWGGMRCIMPQEIPQDGMQSCRIPSGVFLPCLFTDVRDPDPVD